MRFKYYFCYLEFDGTWWLIGEQLAGAVSEYIYILLYLYFYALLV